MEAFIDVAERQGGVISRAQLLAHGLTRGQIARRVRDGRLLPLFRGVFAVGHRALRPEGWWRAALLAVGDDAVLSHQTAAMALRLLPIPPGPVTDRDGRPRIPLHVTVPRHARPQPGLTVHRAVTPVVHPDRLRVVDLPCTSWARTLIDLADVLDYPALHAVADEVRRFDVAWLTSVHARTPGRRGAPQLRRLIVSAEGGVTKSVLERRLAGFLDEHGLPEPDRRNVKVAGVLVDAVYDGPRVAIELDSRSWHSRQREMDADRRRDWRLGRADHVCMRLMPEHLEREWAGTTARELRGLLAERGARHQVHA